MRLGDLDALERAFRADARQYPDCEAGLGWAAGILLCAPTIDAVPVVRCRECVHAKPIPDAKVNYFADGVKCCEILRGDETYGVSVVWDEGYCDDGKRKEGST